MNSPLSGDSNILATRSDGATLHRSCTIYGGTYYSWDESVGLSFLRLNKGANVVRGRPEAPVRERRVHRSSVALESPSYSSAGIAGLAIA
jgi:hypothetical protein